jgi:hypothetical protein
VLFRNAAYTGGGVMPPLLLQQESLIDEFEGPLSPGFVDKSMILRQRFDACFALLAPSAASLQVTSEPHRLADRFVMSWMRLPGANARCTAQSEYACASAAGDTPAVKRAVAACSERSVMSANAVTL